jgi:hypothetical protein
MRIRYTTKAEGIVS